ncbi:HAD family hydrolase [Rhodanobacter glycinis]|uniref:phosphoglycolate phosphatase n=1 Tax=Rhodanobacter glycinis TaxID=582702 RepID=A0A5B9E146_9GAMM|nr:HAD family hydrolase [Rhodanobacter glycinis]QEE25648.1 HAD family hydrolase [Rhodanobacter glycinis]
MIPHKTVVLDLDGPLLDGVLRHYQCYSDILAEHGFVAIPMDQYWEMKRARVDRNKLLALSGATEFYDTFLAHWLQRIESRDYLALDRVQDGAVETLTRWKGLGMRLLLATMRNNTQNLEWQLEQHGLITLLDRVVTVGSSHAGAAKATHVRPLLLNSRAGETIWVGDTEVDIYAARELEVDVCALTCGLRTREYLASLSPDLLEPSLVAFAESEARL